MNMSSMLASKYRAILNKNPREGPHRRGFHTAFNYIKKIYRPYNRPRERRWGFFRYVYSEGDKVIFNKEDKCVAIKKAVG